MAIQDAIPKSRVTLRYKTTITGSKEDVELPLRFCVLGDFSQDGEIGDLEEREVFDVNGGNLDEVMKEMKLSIDVEVPSPYGDGTEQVHLPIDGMRSFSPDAIAERIPSVRSLLLMRQLLTELQANISNQRNFRNELKKRFKGGELQAMMAALEKQGYGNFKLPAPAAAVAEAPAAAAPPPAAPKAPSKDKPADQG